MEKNNNFKFKKLEQFSEWETINDSIMGGSSNAICFSTPDGLVLEGELVEEGGGFVSCRSPVFTPPVDLSAYKGLEFIVDGQGHNLKIALACRDRVMGISELIPGGLRWVAPMPTSTSGSSLVVILFKDLLPAVRAKAVKLPFKFESSAVTRIQLLYSKFGQPGEINHEFSPGPIRILLRSIRGFK